MDMIDLIIKFETEGLETEEEVIAYTVALIASGLANSTGSNQRFVQAMLDGPLADSIRAELEVSP